MLQGEPPRQLARSFITHLVYLATPSTGATSAQVMFGGSQTDSLQKSQDSPLSISEMSFRVRLCNGERDVSRRRNEVLLLCENRVLHQLPPVLWRQRGIFAHRQGLQFKGGVQRLDSCTRNVVQRKESESFQILCVRTAIKFVSKAPQRTCNRSPVPDWPLFPFS